MWFLDITGSDEQSIDHAKLFALTMNKTARDTSLGELISAQKIKSEEHLNQFILSNLNGNLFDHRDFQETIEYLRENMSTSSRFNFTEILNKLCQPDSGQEEGETDSQDDAFVARDVHLLSCFIWKAFSNTSCRYYVNVTN